VVFGRRERLAVTGGVSQEELERARLDLSGARDARDAAAAQLDAARADLAAARTVLDVRRSGATDRSVSVRAPIGGVVLRLIEEHERVVPPGALLAQVGEPADLEVVVPLLTADAERVKPGAAVAFTTGAGTPPLRAVVTVIEPAAFTKLSPLGVQEQRVNVIAKVQGVAAGIGDAFRVDARITVDERRDATIVPLPALVRHGDGWSVWVVQGGRALARGVGLGARASDGAQVTAGLSRGDTVVLYPPDAIANGARIRPGAPPR
jgi:HlyD family secretion protein